LVVAEFTKKLDDALEVCSFSHVSSWNLVLTYS
jgi:hypothetical protein